MNAIFFFLLFSPMAFSQVPEGHAVGRGNVAVVTGSSWIRGWSNTFSAMIRNSAEIEIDFDHNRKMSVVQKFVLGGSTWENRYDILWEFGSEFPEGTTYRLLNAGNGKVIGQAFCGGTICEYNLELAEKSLKIWERIERYPALKGARAGVYDLMGTMTESNSWFGPLTLYYRAQMKAESKSVD